MAKLVPKVPGAGRELLFAEDEDFSGVRNVVPILDTGETEDEWALVMPRAERSLRDHLDAVGPTFDPADEIPILRDVAQALVDLAAKDIVHRDLKPENVLLLNGRWCLADFGISRYAEATTAPDTHKYSLTREYAAPEQWRLERATAATDVYAFGVMGYEMLAGARPFDGPDYRYQHLHEQPRALTGLPAPLVSLIEYCLMKASGSRPTANEILARLEAQARATPLTGGLAALEEANRAEVARLSELSRRESKGKSESERRAALLLDAERQFGQISTALQDNIRMAASAVEQIPLSTMGFRRGTAQYSWSLKLNNGALLLTPISTERADERIPFDIIAASQIRVEKLQQASHGYKGRSHSLWFCDANEPGRYRWYETAFMLSPFSGQSSAINPFALYAHDLQAGEALQGGMNLYQPAWPFTPVMPGELNDFIGRWANWFAQAAQNRLFHPSSLPELPVRGSWRTH